MKISLISNFINHHQSPLCDKLYSILGEDFSFISCTEISEERLSLGWDNVEYPYNKKLYSDKNVANECQKLIDDADVVIFGSAPEYLLKNRKKNKKIIFRYSERPLKRGNEWLKYIPRLFKWNIRNTKETYLLCSSGYTAADYSMFNLYKNRAYKWGYFPPKLEVDEDQLIYAKEPLTILWCGRLLSWKHPEAAILVAKKLKDEGMYFKLNIIGVGEMESELKKIVETFELSDCVNLLGQKKVTDVRRWMELSSIYLFTSDYNEGWGAVLNEAMNSGCAVITSHAIGAVPFLIEHNNNGIIYENQNVQDLYDKLKYLLLNPKECERLGRAAYKTILNLWNSNIAAERFITLAEEITDHGYCDVFKEGPCSKAENISNHWFKIKGNNIL